MWPDAESEVPSHPCAQDGCSVLDSTYMMCQSVRNRMLRLDAQDGLLAGDKPKCSARMGRKSFACAAHAAGGRRCTRSWQRLVGRLGICGAGAAAPGRRGCGEPRGAARRLGRLGVRRRRRRRRRCQCGRRFAVLSPLPAPLLPGSLALSLLKGLWVDWCAAAVMGLSGVSGRASCPACHTAAAPPQPLLLFRALKRVMIKCAVCMRSVEMTDDISPALTVRLKLVGLATHTRVVALHCWDFSRFHSKA